MSPFKKLGLTESASPAEVKAAWRRLASEHHPDREGGDSVAFDEYRKAYTEALAEASEPKPCQDCKGEGKVLKNSGFASIKMTCPTCDGAGTIPVSQE